MLRRSLRLLQTSVLLRRGLSSRSSSMLLSGGRVRSLGRQRPATLTALNSDYPSTPTSTLPFAADSSNIHLVDNLPSPPSPSSPKLQGLVLLSSSSPPATLSLLRQSAWVIGRQIEMMSVLLGYEQANKYVIRDGHGNVLGYICEEAQSIRGTILRQVLRTRRAFNADILDAQGNLVLRVSRPIKWLLNSVISISVPYSTTATTTDNNNEMRLIGEVHSSWHLWRRRYDLFDVEKRQFGHIDGELLAWDFVVVDEEGGQLSSVNRNFSGFAREIFTDSGQYVVRMEALQGAARPLTYDERAIVMASAITIDIDYFSRHSGNGGFLPIPMIGGGGGGGVPAPVPNPVGGGVGGMPMPIILPGGGVGDGDGGVTDVSSSSSGTTPSSAYPSQQIVNNNNGGFVPDEASQHEDGFLPDEQDSNGGWLSGFFEDD